MVEGYRYRILAPATSSDHRLPSFRSSTSTLGPMLQAYFFYEQLSLLRPCTYFLNETTSNEVAPCVRLFGLRLSLTFNVSKAAYCTKDHESLRFLRRISTAQED